MFWHSMKSLWRWLVAYSLRSSWGIPLHLDCLSLSVKKVSVNCEAKEKKKKKRKSLLVRKELLAYTAKESSWLPNPHRTNNSKVFLETFRSSPTACKIKVQLLAHDTHPSYSITYFPLWLHLFPSARSRLQMYMFSMPLCTCFSPAYRAVYLCTCVGRK